MNFEEKLRKYAHLLVAFGVNLQKGQYLLLDIEAENYALARLIAEEAMKKGAADVIIHWSDAVIDGTRARYGQADCLGEVAPWEEASYADYIQRGACSLRIISTAPTAFDGAEPAMAAKVQGHAGKTRNILRRGTAEKEMRWCIAAAPTQDWASYLFPALPADEAVGKLWDVFFQVCRIDENDAIQNWLNAMGVNKKYAAILNEYPIDSIHFTNGYGTDLMVGFHPDVRWVGAMEDTYTPDVYLPNIPTAEVSSSPDRYRVNGTVTASRPLMEKGKMIRDFGFTFRNGEVVDFHAGEGYETLKGILDTDEGSRYLGEVAFVERDSPIAQTGLLFLNTLLDENAACHLALGRGFSVLFNGLPGTDYAAWEKVHLNNSAVHVDFMFGTEDMQAEITLRDGRKGIFFRDGKFNPDVEFT